MIDAFSWNFFFLLFCQRKFFKFLSTTKTNKEKNKLLIFLFKIFYFDLKEMLEKFWDLKICSNNQNVKIIKGHLEARIL